MKSLKLNNKRGLLAVVMALAMVFAGAVFVADEVDAAKITYISGEIMDDQTYGQGAIVVMNGDLTIEEGKSLIIGQGASFTIQDGYKLTVSKDAKLVVYNGAYFNAIGDIEVKSSGTIENGAAYNGTTKVDGSYAGFYVSGTIDVAKGAKITAVTVTTTGGSASGVAANIVDRATGEDYTSQIAVTEEGNTFTITGTVPYHMNGAGNYGYWVGAIINGEPYYTSAGMTRDVEISGTTYTIDATTVNGGKTGQMIVNGTIQTTSTGTTASEVRDQLISIADGASVSIKGIIGNTTVSAFSATNVINTYGSVLINGTGVTDLSFTTVTEKIPNAFINTVDVAQPTSKATTKAVNLILDVEGTVEGDTELTVIQTAADAGVDKRLMYPDVGGKTASDIEMKGTVRVSGDLSVAATGTFTTTEGSILDVDGTVTVKGKDDTQTANLVLDGVAYVSGTIEVDSVDGGDKTVVLDLSDSISDRTAYIVIEGDGSISIKDYDPVAINWANSPAGLLGATYAIDDEFYVSNLTKAIEAAVAADESEVSVWGLPDDAPVVDKAYVVDADTVIPEIDLSLMYNIVVAEGTTLTISEDASISAGNPGAVIVVDGIMLDYTLENLAYADSGRVAGSLKVIAEVKAIDADETYYKYTILATSLSTANAGDVIQLFGNVTLKDNLTIPMDITVDTYGKDINVPKNKVLTVDGILDMVAGGSVLLEKADAAMTWDSDGKVVVNNMVVNPSVKLDGTDTFVAGIYADGTIGDYEIEEFILSPAVAAENSATISNLAVQEKTTYNGDLVFTAGEDNVADLTVNANFTTGALTIAGYTLVISDSGLYTGEITTTNGALEMTSVRATASEQVVVANIVDDDAGTDIITITGTPVKVDKDGMTTGDSKKNVAKIGIASGVVTVTKDTSFNVAGIGFTVAENTTLDVYGTVTFVNMTIDGAVNINGGAALNNTASGKLEVLGTLFVKQADAEDSTTGTVTVNGDIYVGTTKKAVTGSVATIDAATLTCNVMYVAAGSAVSEDVTENKDYIEFVVEDALYITAYQMDVGSTTATVEKAPVEDAKFLGWNNDKGTLIVDETTEEPVYAISFEKYDKVTAAIDYNIYTVNIVADNGIGTVAIDGIVLQKNGNTFSASKLTAGEHTLSYELKNGYEGTVKMTVDGKSVDGYKFTLSGTDADDLVVDINLSGTTQIEYTTATDSGEDGGMSLVEILLIVLVVLVVILAVIVALRMMRS